MSATKHSRSRNFFGFVSLFVCVLIALGLLANRQTIQDFITVWQYSPSSEIASFAEKTHMSDKGKFYFYASNPSVEPRSGFSEKCGAKERNTAILGCYDGRNIYIQNITDERLNGIREVTSAHEMLHAAYDRLDEKEKLRINSLLEAEYEKLKNDATFTERMAFYARTEPGQRGNELHSVIGTEVPSMSKELEEHYGKYFKDRSKVVALHVSYAKLFSDLQERGVNLSTELTNLADQIKASSSEYNSQVQALNRDIETFNQKANSNGFTTQMQFLNERSTLLARAESLDEKRNQINSEVARYEQIREELIGVASESEALNKSIDSSLAPAPSL